MNRSQRFDHRNRTVRMARMEKIRFPLLVALIAVFLLFGAAGCSGSQAAVNEPEQPEAQSVAESQAQADDSGEMEVAAQQAEVAPEQPQPAAGGAAGVDIYSLISLEEVSGFMGESMLEPEYSENTAVGQEILFFATEAETLPLRFFQISISNGNAAVDAATLYSETRDTLLGEDVQMVEGYGDEAAWGTMGLHILKGGHYIVLSVGNTDKPENLELAKQFADVILPRLP